jgi:hypothetical protein
MIKYVIVALVLCGLMMWLCAGIASAGCCKDKANKPGHVCSEDEGCGQAPCSGGGVVDGTGTVKSLDLERNEVVISHEGAEDVTVIVDRALAERLKVGDAIKLTYEKKCVNVATEVRKQRSGFKTPPPCTDKRS